MEDPRQLFGDGDAKLPNMRKSAAAWNTQGNRQLQKLAMPFVVTDSCILCKYTNCVDVCPMNCFREGPNFLVIAPDECIDCSMCVPECPVGAIYNEIDLPDEQRHFSTLNAELAARTDWKPITRSKAPLPEHALWRSANDKLAFLEVG